MHLQFEQIDSTLNDAEILQTVQSKPSQDIPFEENVVKIILQVCNIKIVECIVLCLFLFMFYVNFVCVFYNFAE